MVERAEVKIGDKHFLLVRESLLQSVISDLKTLLVVLIIIGVGIYCKSVAMQWVGFLMLVVMAMARANPKVKRLSSVDEACAWLRRESAQ